MRSWTCDRCGAFLWLFAECDETNLPTCCSVCHSKKLNMPYSKEEWYPLEINVELKILAAQQEVPVVYEMHYRDNDGNEATNLIITELFHEMTRDFRNWLINSIAEVSREESIKVFSYAGCFSPLATVSVQWNLKSRFDNTIEIK